MAGTKRGAGLHEARSQFGDIVRPEATMLR